MIGISSSSTTLRRPRAPLFALHRFLGDGVQCVLGKDELGIVEVEQLLVLAHNAVLRLGQNSDKSFLVQRVKHRHNGQTADQLGDETKLDEVVGLDLLQQLLARLILVQRCAQLAAKSRGRRCRCASE